MPATDNDDRLPSPAFQEAFRAGADANGQMPFDRFMDLALYHPDLGYYRTAKKRVGFGQGTDFYTATTTGPLFGELVHAACQSLLGNENLKSHAFIELGAEPDGGILSGVGHTFGSTRTVRIGEPVTLHGPCVVFSNELFDAQPFRRFKFLAGSWRELGVRLDQGGLQTCVLDTNVDLKTWPSLPPATPPEGYVIDLPVQAKTLAETIASQSWTGLFLAFDYGKSWQELTQAAPAGTARAYHQHQQSNDLLARPGQQDLTCHICWDWLSEALQQHGFCPPNLETQEAFLIRRAAPFLSATLTTEASRLSQRKLGLLQLLHHLGQKFQVLWALRQ